MTPFELILWVFTICLCIIAAGITLAIIIGSVQSITRSHRKRDGGGS